MLRRFAYEQFLNALLDCIQYSRNIRNEEADVFMEASNVSLKKFPEEVQKALKNIIDKAMFSAVEDEAALGTVEDCLAIIIAGSAPEEVNDLMQKYHEASRKMFEADFEGRTVAMIKAQYELECLEGDLMEQGYLITGGYEAYCNLFEENFDPEDFD